jgi:hypothetical protein
MSFPVSRQAVVDVLVDVREDETGLVFAMSPVRSYVWYRIDRAIEALRAEDYCPEWSSELRI